MAHDAHGSHHDHSHSGSGFHNIRLAFCLNFAFTIIEIVGAWWTGSVAVLADAVHDLGDTVSLGVALGLEKYSERRADATFSYGYRRFSLLSALLSGLAMLLASAFVFFEVWQRFNASEAVLPKSGPMMGLAIFGILANSAAMWRLSKGRSQNEKILYLHFLEDVAGWVLVLVGAVLIRYQSWTWLDPLLALGLNLFILKNIVRNLWQTFRLFLQASPDDFREVDFRRRVLEVPGVESIHDLHVWSLDGHRNILSLHVVLSRDAYAIADKIKRRIADIAAGQSLTKAQYHLTIETELSGDSCRESC